MLIPAPVVVDANVLIRNVEYAIRTERTGALLGQASSNYSLLTGVVLFAAAEVRDEAVRHLPDVAERRAVSLEQVRAVWNELIVPTVRFVALRDGAVDDPRVEEVRNLDPPDAHSAALTALLAPAVLATDNRKHFRPFGLPGVNEVKTDAIAIDLFALGQFGLGVKGTMLFPALTGAVTFDGSKKVVAKLGGDVAALIGLVILGGVVLFLASDRGRDLRARLGEVARDLGPPLAELMERTTAAGDRVAAFAVEPVGEANALAVIARRLAIGQSVMTTRDVADALRQHGFGLEGGRRHETETRAWLVRELCFHELSRGRWALGYHDGPLVPPIYNASVAVSSGRSGLAQ